MNAMHRFAARHGGSRTPRQPVAVEPHTPRSGVTLTEVLVSILIMSIGVISVAALFPIAVLRSAQATTLTSATILKQNADAIINSFPELVHDPDGDSQPDAFGDNPGMREHFNQEYIVDPLGFYLARSDNRMQSQAIDNVDPPKRFGGIPLAYGNLSSQAEQFMWDLCSLPDNLTEIISGEVDGSLISVTVDQKQLRATFVDLQNALNDGQNDLYLLSDLQLFCSVDLDEDLNANGRFDNNEDLNGNGKFDRPFSFSANVTAVGQDGSVTFQPPSISFNLGETPITRVRLDVREAKYTWMLTVRKNSEGEANGNIAIFFKREFSSEDEEIHQAYQYVTDAQGQTSGPFAAQVGGTTIRFAPQDNRSTALGPWSPLLRASSYILDVDNMHWYRVKSVTSEGQTDAGNQDKSFVEVQLDTPVRQTFTNAMLMRGIVAVFPISTQGL